MEVPPLLIYPCYLTYSKCQILCPQICDEANVFSRRVNENNGIYDIIEFSNTVENLRKDEVIKNNSVKSKAFTKHTNVDVEIPHIYSTNRDEVGILPYNKNSVARSSQIPVLCGHFDIECCCCFHKQRELKQKQGMIFLRKLL